MRTVWFMGSFDITTVSYNMTNHIEPKIKLLDIQLAHTQAAAILARPPKRPATGCEI